MWKDLFIILGLASGGALTYACAYYKGRHAGWAEGTNVRNGLRQRLIDVEHDLFMYASGQRQGFFPKDAVSPAPTAPMVPDCSVAVGGLCSTTCTNDQHRGCVKVVDERDST